MPSSPRKEGLERDRSERNGDVVGGASRRV